ncbi:MAG: hypothetical protein IPK21_22010 [Haliscomenobacter sp.]|nr:hypothetical protein [Haliscomenobacter sp.]
MILYLILSFASLFLIISTSELGNFDLRCFMKSLLDTQSSKSSIFTLFSFIYGIRTLRMSTIRLGAISKCFKMSLDKNVGIKSLGKLGFVDLKQKAEVAFPHMRKQGRAFNFLFLGLFE